MLQQHCGFSTDHPLYSLHTQASVFGGFTDNSDKTTAMNSRMPAMNTVLENKKRSPATVDTIEATLQLTKVENVQDRSNVYSSCAGLPNGRYYVQIDFKEGSPIVIAQCSNGYMLIDYSSDNNWKGYFSSWIQFHWQVASPFKVE